MIKYIIFFALQFMISISSFAQIEMPITSITIRHISTFYFNHHIPVYYISNQPSNIKMSNMDSTYILTDQKSFDFLAKFIRTNKTEIKFDSVSDYEYGCVELSLNNKDCNTIDFIINNNSNSIIFFNKMIQYMKLNKADSDLTNKLVGLIPNPTESELR